MTKLFPGVRTVAAALGLTGKNAKTAKNDLKAFGDTSGATAKAMAQMAKTPAGAWQHFKSTMQSLGNELALKVLPTITSVANALTDLFSGKGKVGKAASGFMSGLTKGMPPATGQAAPPIVGPMDAYGGHSWSPSRRCRTSARRRRSGRRSARSFRTSGRRWRRSQALGVLSRASSKRSSRCCRCWCDRKNSGHGVGRGVEGGCRVLHGPGNVIGTVIKIIGGALKGVLTAFKAVWTGISWAVNAVSNGISWLWHNVLDPVGKFIAGAFMVAITPFKLAWDAINTAVSVVSGALSWLWHNVLAPFAKFISGTLIAPFQALVGVINAIGTAANAAFNGCRRRLAHQTSTINPVNPITHT